MIRAVITAALVAAAAVSCSTPPPCPDHPGQAAGVTPPPACVTRTGAVT